MRPLPDKHKGLTDTELRYRQRYVDLMTNQRRVRCLLRSKVIAAIRHFFESRGFLEVETPMLQVILVALRLGHSSRTTTRSISICIFVLRPNYT